MFPHTLPIRDNTGTTPCTLSKSSMRQYNFAEQESNFNNTEGLGKQKVILELVIIDLIVKTFGCVS
ncbi:hypothetical protein QTP88_029770 [Uroleucon formosanum]